MGNKLYLICINFRLNPLPIYLSRASFLLICSCFLYIKAIDLSYFC